jgi:hypothetical protein
MTHHTSTSTLNFSAAYLPDSVNVETGTGWRFQTPKPGLYLIALHGTCSGGIPLSTCRVQLIQKDPPALAGELTTVATATLGVVGSDPIPISSSATVYLSANEWVYATGDASVFANFNGEISIVRLR